jgi:uncharacterized protein YfdQ (DUF2303 family)
MSTTEAEVVRDLAFEALKPTIVKPGQRYAWLGSDDTIIEHDLTEEMPARKTGTVQVGNVASFAHYYGKHADSGSEVYVDIDEATLTAVLDAHGDAAARYQDHRLLLTLTPTVPWQTWMAANNRWMTQQQFAEFLEMNAADVDPTGPVSSADLLEIAQKFQVHSNVHFESGKRLANGANHLVFSEEVTATGGDRGQIDVPSEFQLGIRPYEDCPQGYRIKAWFRFETPRDGSLKVRYVLDDPERKARLAVESIVAQVAETIGITVMVGQPTAA